MRSLRNKYVCTQIVGMNYQWAVSKVSQKGHNANVEYFCRNLINKDGSSIKIIVEVREVVKWITLA